jgi:hypothetical protein
MKGFICDLTFKTNKVFIKAFTELGRRLYIILAIRLCRKRRD